MELLIPSRGGVYLFLGNRISPFHLEPEDAKGLANLHLRDARRDWAHDGNVSFRAGYDHP